MRKRLQIISFIGAILICSEMRVQAQNAPVTSCGDAALSNPGNFSVPVSVTGFINIGAVSLTLDYQYSVIQFVQGTSHPQLSGFQTGDEDLGNGFHRISMGWYGNGTTLPDGSAIMTLTFHYSSGNTSLSWFDNGPTCQWADANYTVLNDIPTDSFYIDGYVCQLPDIPGPISGDEEICEGDQGIIYSIGYVPGANGYSWTVPPGAVIISGQGTNSVSVDFPFNAMSGMVTVSAFNTCGTGPPSELAVLVNDPPVADAGEDFSIDYGTSTTLHAAPGGPGNYSYYWSPEDLLIDPYSKDPQTVILTSTTLFTLLVTDLEGLCQNSDQVIVTISGGPLSVNPAAVPPHICYGGSAQLFTNAGGGSGDYSYLWTCLPEDDPPWTSTLPDPVVSPDSSKLYQVVADDGFTSVSGTVNLTVCQLPTASLSGGDTLCGTGNSAVLTVDLTGEPPWNFAYSYGNTSVHVYNQTVSPYYILAEEAGTYVLSFVEDMNCTGTTSGSAEVYIFPVPPRPEIIYTDPVLVSDACCGNQWYLDGSPIPGATSQTHYVTQSGEYFDIVTLNGCSSEPSETIGIIVGVPEDQTGTLRLYPNPGHNRIHIELPGNLNGPVEATLYTASGKTARDFKLRERAGSYCIDLNGLPKGMYFLVVRTTKGKIAGKLEIE